MRNNEILHQQNCTCAEMECLLQSLKAIGLVIFYYFFSISLTFYNKWILMVTTLAGSQKSNNRPTSLSLSPGLPVSPLNHHDSLGSQVHTGLAGQEGYILLHQTAFSCAWVEGLLKKYCSCRYAQRLLFGFQGGVSVSAATRSYAFAATCGSYWIVMSF